MAELLLDKKKGKQKTREQAFLQFLCSVDAVALEAAETDWSFVLWNATRNLFSFLCTKFLRDSQIFTPRPINRLNNWKIATNLLLLPYRLVLGVLLVWNGSAFANVYRLCNDNGQRATDWSALDSENRANDGYHTYHAELKLSVYVRFVGTKRRLRAFSLSDKKTDATTTAAFTRRRIVLQRPTVYCTTFNLRYSPNIPYHSIAAFIVTLIRLRY